MHLKKMPLWLLRRSEQAVVLRGIAEPVDLNNLLDLDFQKLIDRMIVTMYAAKGIGLAAPQIGQRLRLAVITKHVTGGDDELVLINPKLSALSPDQEELEEGCLSIPGKFGPVKRSLTLTLTAFDRFGKKFQLEARQLLARVIQHEVDHLNGRLYIDRVVAPTEY